MERSPDALRPGQLGHLVVLTLSTRAAERAVCEPDRAVQYHRNMMIECGPTNYLVTSQRATVRNPSLHNGLGDHDGKQSK